MLVKDLIQQSYVFELCLFNFIFRLNAYFLISTVNSSHGGPQLSYLNVMFIIVVGRESHNHKAPIQKSSCRNDNFCEHHTFWISHYVFNIIKIINYKGIHDWHAEMFRVLNCHSVRKNVANIYQINTREYRGSNKKWTMQRNWQHNQDKENKAKTQHNIYRTPSHANIHKQDMSPHTNNRSQRRTEPRFYEEIVI